MLTGGRLPIIIPLLRAFTPLAVEQIRPPRADTISELRRSATAYLDGGKGKHNKFENY